MHAESVEISEARTVRRKIAQARSENQAVRFKALPDDLSVARRDAKEIIGDALNLCDAAFDDETAVIRYFFATAFQKFRRHNAVMAEKAVYAV